MAATVQELRFINFLVDKATGDLEHGRVDEAREAIALANSAHERFCGQIAAVPNQSDRDLLMLRQQQTRQAISRVERRLSSHSENGNA
jgi:hypothetical protein